MNKDIVVAQVNTPMDIIQAAVSGGGDVAQLEKLMELQERWEDRESKKAYDKALAVFKAEPIKIGKDSHVKYKTTKGVVDYKHATLGNIIDILNPALSKCGLSVSWRTAVEGTHIKVTAVLSHELGHSESTYLVATADSTGSKNALQAVGSTISYLRRYTALAITGLTTEELDDDGDRGGNAQPQGEGYKAPPDQTEDTTYLNQCIAYIDTYCDKTLDEFIALKESRIKETYPRLLNDMQRQKLKSHVNSVEQLLIEKEGGAA